MREEQQLLGLGLNKGKRAKPRADTLFHLELSNGNPSIINAYLAYLPVRSADDGISVLQLAHQATRP